MIRLPLPVVTVLVCLAMAGGNLHADVHEPAPGRQPPSIVVGPFLQSATPTSIMVVWETTSEAESRVDYGTTPALGQTAYGSVADGFAGSLIHETLITDLDPDTYYYYRASTAGTASAVLHFRTPPLPSSEMPFRFLAYSDTQNDGANPAKHSEIVNDGMIDFVTESFGPDMSDEVAFVLHAGDFVVAGSVYSQWKTQFFDEAQDLLQYTPLYPVLGNHEQDSINYFKYFSLPKNGTAGFYGHWYYVDYSNARIIALDSNTGYRVQEQLDWLDLILADACVEPDIDFVFAQLHHPYKSEPWTPGETDYTGEVIGRLEQFSTDCGKPSIHFFGHTHAYSRGQSRDHDHLWVNVASGEGNIDYWGEFANADYPEFQRSLVEWGFVLVEIEAGGQPRLRLRRVSRGNEVVQKDNEVVDDVTIRIVNIPPDMPEAVFPTPVQSPIDPDTVTLVGSTYSDPDGDGHLEVHFQLTATAGDYSAPVVDEWRRFENLYSPPGASGMSDGYFSVDTEEDADITRSTSFTLQPAATYHWRVRYRDEGLRWSDWSAESSFDTGQSSVGGNLLINPGGEDGTSGWTEIDPPLESLLNAECGSVPPWSGSRNLAVGGVCSQEGPYGEAFQPVDVSFLASEIDGGGVIARFGGRMRSFSGSDVPELWLVLKDGVGAELGATAKLSSTASVWTLEEGTTVLPAGTRVIEFHLSGTRVAGVDNDSYFDNLLLSVGSSSPSGRLPGDGGGVSGVPLRISKLTGGEIELTWGASCSPGDTDFEVYEGPMDGLFTGHAPRLCSTSGAATSALAPSEGDSYFLVVPRNATNEGSYGLRGDGSERPPGFPACYEQASGGCD